MKIYTRQGDGGETGLFDGRGVRKDDLRIETYGTVDELNSHLGLVLAGTGHEGIRGRLVRVQGELFELGADLATPAESGNVGKVRRVGTWQVEGLEKAIDGCVAELPGLKHFILPGGGETGARLHVARTVCRRAERLAVALMDREEINPLVVVYLNRLGDLLFVLGRLANRLDGVGDVEWVADKLAMPDKFATNEH